MAIQASGWPKLHNKTQGHGDCSLNKGFNWLVCLEFWYLIEGKLTPKLHFVFHNTYPRIVSEHNTDEMLFFCAEEKA